MGEERGDADARERFAHVRVQLVRDLGRLRLVRLLVRAWRRAARPRRPAAPRARAPSRCPPGSARVPSLAGRVSGHYERYSSRDGRSATRQHRQAAGRALVRAALLRSRAASPTSILSRAASGSSGCRVTRRAARPRGRRDDRRRSSTQMRAAERARAAGGPDRRGRRRLGDGSAEIARAPRRRGHQEDELLPQLGPVLGKGDAMWRALSVARGDLVLYLDSDTPTSAATSSTGCSARCCRVRGRALREGRSTAGLDRRRPASAGRRRPRHRADGEAAAQPLLSASWRASRSRSRARWPARRELLCSIPFLTGYAVETGMLIDVLEPVGLDAMAQVDLGTRTNRNQPLFALGRMSYAVLLAVELRLRGTDAVRTRPARRAVDASSTCTRSARSDDLRLERTRGRVVERPPMAELLAAPDADSLRRRGAALRLHRPRQHDARQGRVAAARRRGQLLAAAVRALEACHRAGVEVVIKSGRRKAQVYEDARLIGQPAYIYEMGCGLADGAEEVFLTGDLEPLPERTVYEQIEDVGSARAAAAGASRAGSSTTTPGTATGTFSHLFRGEVDLERGRRAARASTATATCASSTTASPSAAPSAARRRRSTPIT